MYRTDTVYHTFVTIYVLYLWKHHLVNLKLDYQTVATALNTKVSTKVVPTLALLNANYSILGNHYTMMLISRMRKHLFMALQNLRKVNTLLLLRIGITIMFPHSTRYLSEICKSENTLL